MPHQPDAAVVAAFAPGGRLRVAINLGNPILAGTDAASGDARGVSVDLAQALATHLGCGIELLLFDAAAKSVEAVRRGGADVGFLPSIRCAAKASASARPTCSSKAPTWSATTAP